MRLQVLFAAFISLSWIPVSNALANFCWFENAEKEIFVCPDGSGYNIDREGERIKEVDVFRGPTMYRVGNGDNEFLRIHQKLNGMEITRKVKHVGGVYRLSDTGCSNINEAPEVRPLLGVWMTQKPGSDRIWIPLGALVETPVVADDNPPPDDPPPPPPPAAIPTFLTVTHLGKTKQYDVWSRDGLNYITLEKLNGHYRAQVRKHDNGTWQVLTQGILGGNESWQNASEVSFDPPTTPRPEGTPTMVSVGGASKRVHINPDGTMYLEMVGALGVHYNAPFEPRPDGWYARTQSITLTGVKYEWKPVRIAD